MHNLTDNNFYQLLQWAFYINGNVAIAIYLGVTVRAIFKK